MTGAALLIAFDADLEGGFQRAFCAGLEALQVAHADASAIDADPETPPVIDLYVVSAARGGTGAMEPPHALMVIGGPGGREHVGRTMRLEAHDIESGSKRWAVLAGRIGERVGRPGLADYVLASGEDDRRAWALAHPRDPLAADLAESQKPDVLARQLALETRRADVAEAALQQLQRDIDVSTIDRRRAESGAASSHARIVQLEAENALLKDRLEHTEYALPRVPEGGRDCVEEARNAAARARIASAQAIAAAEAHPGALVWPKGHAAYSGETKNKHPDGLGVMTFVTEASKPAFYRGDFKEGRREGYGIGRSEEGSVWAGQWFNDAACGFGILETSNGRRFEGELEPSEIGPQMVERMGYIWPVTAERSNSPPDPIPLIVEPRVKALPRK